MRAEPGTLAFAVHGHTPPALEVRVNFGMFAGREATPAEIDALGQQVLEKVGSVSIVSEERHEINARSEASVHQVRIEVPADSVPPEAGQRLPPPGPPIDTAGGRAAPGR